MLVATPGHYLRNTQSKLVVTNGNRNHTRPSYDAGPHGKFNLSVHIAVLAHVHMTPLMLDNAPQTTFLLLTRLTPGRIEIRSARAVCPCLALSI